MTFPRSSKSPPRHHSADCLYEQHGEFVLRAIRKLVSDHEQADDIYQELFLTMLTRPLYCPEEDVRPYLYRAASNEVMDYKRRKHKYRQAVREYRRDSSQSEACRPHCPLERAEQQRQAMQLLDFMESHLPRCESQAIINRYKHEHDLGHTACVMGVSRSTVARYVSNGFKKIRESLALRGGHIDEII